MTQPDYVLELLLMGAILADPKLMPKVKGFSHKKLQEVLEGMRKGDVEKLRAWLLSRKVVFNGGRAIESVRMQQNGNRIRAEMEYVGRRMKFESPVAETFGRLMERMKELRAEHEANATEKKNASEIQKPPQSKVGSQVNQASTAAKKETQAQSKPVGSASLSGGKQ